MIMVDTTIVNIAVPTLVRKLPEPVRKIIGDLSDTEKLLVGLQLRHGGRQPGERRRARGAREGRRPDRRGPARAERHG